MKALKLIPAIVGLGLFALPVLNADSTTVSTTGCLARGEGAHVYSLKDQNGTTYQLFPGAYMNLRRHVGQEVMISGTVTRKGQSRASQIGAIESLRVHNVKKVSNSCS
jgi:hypothetical protein